MGCMAIERTDIECTGMECGVYALFPYDERQSFTVEVS